MSEENIMNCSLVDVYNKLKNRVTKNKDYEITDIESECLFYNQLIKNLDKKDRDMVCCVLSEMIRYHEYQENTIKHKFTAYKPKTVAGVEQTKTYIYDIVQLGDVLRDVIILCLREHIFPEAKV